MLEPGPHGSMLISGTSMEMSSNQAWTISVPDVERLVYAPMTRVWEPAFRGISIEASRQPESESIWLSLLPSKRSRELSGPSPSGFHQR